jgi:hypothetical protein
MGKLLAEIIAPAAIEAALQLGERWWGLFVLIPVNVAITREWGALAFLLGVTSAAVASPYFAPPHREYGVNLLVLNVGVILASLVPLILPRLEIPADWLAALIRVAYLVFHAAVGVLIGGAWSWWLKKAREGRAPSPEPEGRGRPSW